MIYFDTSFLVPLLLPEAASSRVEAYLRELPPGDLYVSDWTLLEFASVLSTKVRMRAVSALEAARASKRFDVFINESYETLVPNSTDYELACEYVADPAAGLRAGDALHLAVAKNHSATLILTLDEGMLKAGKRLKLPVSRGIRAA